MKYKESGFTLIELLVVIAIISLLSSAIFASVKEVRERAQRQRVVRDFEEMEKALYMYTDSQKATEWPMERSFGQGGNPTMNDIVSNTDVGEYIVSTPEPPFGVEYRYDHDGDTGTCGSTDTAGANLYILDVPSEHVAAIDEIVDQGDGSNCGKIRWKGNTFLYTLSMDGSF